MLPSSLLHGNPCPCYFLPKIFPFARKQIKNVENVNKGTTQSISCFFKQQQKQKKNTVCSGNAIVDKRERETVSAECNGSLASL